MPWNAAAPPPTGAEPPRRARSGRALALLLLAPAVSGCVPVQPADYLDRAFEAMARSSEPAAARPGEPAPRPAPLVAMEMMLRMAEYAAAADRGRHPDRVRSMEPISSPADHAAPAAGRSSQPGSVVAVEPIPNTRDRAAATDRTSRSAGVRGAEPRPDPGPSPDGDAETRTRSLVRQNPWLTRFWMELTSEQQARVERRLHRGGVRLAARGQAEPAAAWDAMGLSDRADLVFGRDAPLARPEPAERREGPAVAGSS